MQYPALLHPGEDGWIIAECPCLPGCVTQGRTRAEALANLREAIALNLESLPADQAPVASRYEFAEVSVAT